MATLFITRKQIFQLLDFLPSQLSFPYSQKLIIINCEVNQAEYKDNVNLNKTIDNSRDLSGGDQWAK